MDFIRLTDEAHRNARDKGFYRDVEIVEETIKGSDDYDAVILRLKIARLALIGTEVSEAVEALRVGEDVGPELADIVIRTMDLAGFLGINLGGEIVKKMQKNLDRPAMHGKLA